MYEARHGTLERIEEPLNGGGDADIRTMITVMAGSLGRDVVIDPELHGDTCFEWDDVPMCVALDYLALRERAVVRYEGSELVRICKLDPPRGHEDLCELRRSLADMRPRTARVRSLYAALAMCERPGEPLGAAVKRALRELAPLPTSGR